MDLSRLDFLKGVFSALGMGAFGGRRIFAAPPGWTPPKKANLVFGVVSDTHLRTTTSGEYSTKYWSDKWLVAALKHFRSQSVDAVLHLGDMAHVGQVEEMEFHAIAWRKVFPNDLAPDGHKVERLFVAGNHDWDATRYGIGELVKKIYPDPEERKKHVLATDMPGHWQRIWGEPYVGAWHREVKGYHFFGRHFRTEEIKTAELVKEIDAKCGLAKSGRPFFHFSHIRAHANLNRALRPYPNAVGFFGHWHASAANWNQIHMLSSGPTLQCPSCAPMGNNSLGAKKFDWTKVDIEGAEAAGKNRQGYVVRVYDDMVVFQRREFGRGGSLGTDWVMPIVSEDSGKCEGWKHPFSKDELKKKIGEPQFRDGAKLEVAFSAAGTQSGGEQKGTTSTESASLHIKIPLADGNKDSRVFLYNVEIRGDADVLHKSVYASGVNMGIGHEPNKGVTTLVVPQSELPRGETLAMTATPFSSLGTHGKSISDQIVRKLV